MPRSCSLATAVILSHVYIAVTWQRVYMSQYYLFIYIQVCQCSRYYSVNIILPSTFRSLSVVGTKSVDFGCCRWRGITSSRLLHLEAHGIYLLARKCVVFGLPDIDHKVYFRRSSNIDNHPSHTNLSLSLSLSANDRMTNGTENPPMPAKRKALEEIKGHREINGPQL